ncbi:MAG: hypothetical protein EU541_04385 [Promethearchaeota archaeon]|nr:MAG: hypothetical protein EU541_04385 [Candidatus Lokiarchaeota archaeon]
MYKIENLGGNAFYIKIMGRIPLQAAEGFSKKFLKEIEGMNNVRVIIDLLDSNLVKIASLDTIIELMNITEERLGRSAFCVPHNPPLREELKYVLEKAQSPKRKIVYSLEEAKQWTGISEIIIKKEKNID